MDLFRLLTPFIYWLLIIVWSFIFVFYIRKLSSPKTDDKFLRFLIVILAIDAFRTLFESLYFGTWYTALSEIIPIEIYDLLAQPHIVFIPKTINLITSFLILFLIVLKWLPEESYRIEAFNALLEEKTKGLQQEKDLLLNEKQIITDSHKKYSQATIFSPFPIMIHAEDGEVLLINNKWTELTGYELNEINTISKWTTKAYGDKSSSTREIIDKLYTLDNSITEGEFHIKTKSGNIRVWDFSSAPLDRLPDGRKVVISTAVDITEKKALQLALVEREDHLRELNKELEKRVNIRTNELKEQTIKLENSNNDLKDFAYIVSHDLKAPLRAISQLSHWLSNDYADKLDSAGKEQLALIAGRAKRMDLLIKGILEYSRIGRDEVRSEPVDLNEIFNESLLLLDVPENITISLTNKLPNVIGDKTRYLQVFQNLIGNAIKFNDKSKGIITITTQTTDNFYQISIHDNGPGIDKKYHDKIYQIFQTLHARDEIESTGIGLTLVKKIIALYNGKIWLESEINNGSTFHFTLPLK